MRGTIVVLFTMILAAPATAQQQVAPWKGPGERQQLVQELRETVDEAERNRAAAPDVIAALRSLASRYDWPWSVRALQDKFEDGDYTDRPAWTPVSGRFWVDGNLGLRSDVALPGAQASAQPEQAPAAAAPQPAEPKGDIGTEVLGAVLQQVLKPRGGTTQDQQQETQPAAKSTPTEPEAERAEIYLGQAIAAGFDLRVALTSQAGDGRLELGPYIGAERREGYRLAYMPAGTPHLAILRYSRWGSSVVDGYEHASGIEDDSVHYVQWLRLANGEMAVFLDGNEVIRVTDKGIQQGFDGIVIANEGGDFAIREIEILTTP